MKVQVSCRDRTRALSTVLAVLNGDAREFERYEADAFAEFGGYRRLIGALCDLVVEGYDVEHGGDRARVRAALIERRQLSEVG
ncbi:hypothetical protein ACPXB3_00370 [Gordonia sp. DT219]|uniref:hypothetical protein n=1 Tax=Gordonia sp. DT219 TaxID=3416658 RepID=UPI003CF4CBBA